MAGQIRDGRMNILSKGTPSEWVSGPFLSSSIDVNMGEKECRKKVLARDTREREKAAERGRRTESYKNSRGMPISLHAKGQIMWNGEGERRFAFFFSLLLSVCLSTWVCVVNVCLSRLLNLQNKNLNNTLWRNIWPVSMIRCWCLPAALLECALVSRAAKSEREMADSLCFHVQIFQLYVL